MAALPSPLFVPLVNIKATSLKSNSPSAIQTIQFHPRGQSVTPAFPQQYGPCPGLIQQAWPVAHFIPAFPHAVSVQGSTRAGLAEGKSEQQQTVVFEVIPNPHKVPVQQRIVSPCPSHLVSCQTTHELTSQENSKLEVNKSSLAVAENQKRNEPHTKDIDLLQQPCRTTPPVDITRLEELTDSNLNKEEICEPPNAKELQTNNVTSPQDHKEKDSKDFILNVLKEQTEVCSEISEKDCVSENRASHHNLPVKDTENYDFICTVNKETDTSRNAPSTGNFQTGNTVLATKDPVFTGQQVHTVSSNTPEETCFVHHTQPLIHHPNSHIPLQTYCDSNPFNPIYTQVKELFYVQQPTAAFPKKEASSEKHQQCQEVSQQVPGCPNACTIPVCQGSEKEKNQNGIEASLTIKNNDPAAVNRKTSERISENCVHCHSHASDHMLQVPAKRQKVIHMANPDLSPFQLTNKMNAPPSLYPKTLVDYSNTIHCVPFVQACSPDQLLLHSVIRSDPQQAIHHPSNAVEVINQREQYPATPFLQGTNNDSNMPFEESKFPKDPIQERHSAI
ncbi:uncharacterized protein LOC131701896 [Acipenser ruthenus]|uniref:uncharacterized protein LOC131701896 n=1 Tax=Acipenser ruthenus TaxID=7906 RepID=UPI00274173AC|nr:uncharacterized protein LOC131701896 [Acipenser ruthenus]